MPDVEPDVAAAGAGAGATGAGEGVGAGAGVAAGAGGGVGAGAACLLLGRSAANAAEADNVAKTKAVARRMFIDVIPKWWMAEL